MPHRNLVFKHSFGDEAVAKEFPNAAEALSATELLINYPAKVVLAVDGESLLLQHACILGVLSELSELWVRLDRGEQAPSVADFYGEYELMLRRDGGFIECVDSWGGGSVRVETDVFRRAMAEWSGRVFGDLETLVPRIGVNEKYRNLRRFVLDVWSAPSTPAA